MSTRLYPPHPAIARKNRVPHPAKREAPPANDRTALQSKRLPSSGLATVQNLVSPHAAVLRKSRVDSAKIEQNRHPAMVAQTSERVLRVKPKKKDQLYPSEKSTEKLSGIPDDYVSIDDFLNTSSAKLKYPDLTYSSNSSGIFVKIYRKHLFLWWAEPEYQIDDFVYLGDRDSDIKDCNQICEKKGYTWHHTGYPHSEQSGTMQLVPTDEHAAIKHWGGVSIAAGKLPSE
jgi:hypothetical protein